MASRKSRRGNNNKNVIPLKKTSASRTQSDSVNHTFDYTESDDEPFDEKATKRSFRVRKNKEAKLTKSSKIKNDSIDVSTCSSEKSASKQASMIANCKKSLKRKTKICLKSETDVRDSAMRKEKKETTAQRKFASHEEQDEEMKDQNDIDDKANLTLRKTDSLKFSTNSQGHVSSQQNQNATIADTPIRSCPLCAAEFSGDTTEEELNRHVNSCLDSKTQAPPYEPVTQNRLSICPNERSANLEVFNNELKDEELAKALQNRELEKISEENLTNELFFCSLCEKDLSRLNAATREVHMNKCADVVERETMQIQKAKRKSLQESSKEFECLICCMQFSTMQLRISHMKQCCESHKVDRRELLYVVRSEQNSRQSLADSNKDESQGQNLKTVNDMLKMPHSNAVNRIEGKVTEGSLKPERKKRIQRKKTRNKEVPVILLRSEDEAKQIANQRATQLIEEQLCLQDGVKENPGSCLPPSSLASKYKCRKRKVKDFDKTSQDLAEPTRITSQPTMAKSSLWQMAETSVSLHDTSNFYVREVFEEELQMTRERLQNEATEGLTKELNSSTAVEENRGSGNSFGAKTRNITPNEPLSKASIFEESFTMTQAEKVAVLDSLGMNCENSINRDTELECSGFIKAEDVRDGEVAQKIQKLNAAARLSLASNFKTLLEDETCKDISIMCAKGTTVKAHKIILLARCPRILADREYIDLKDYSAKTVNALLMYLYSGEVSQYDVSCVGELWKLAKKFSLDILSEVCLLIKEDSQLEERQYTESEDLRTPDVNDVMKTLWEDEDTEDTDKVDEEGQDEDGEHDSAFDENDADDLRSFFATQREQVVPGDPEIVRVDSGNREDIMTSSRGSYCSMTVRQSGLLDVGSTIDNRSWKERKSFDVIKSSQVQVEDRANGETVSSDFSQNEGRGFFNTANDRARLKDGATQLDNEDISTLNLECKRMSSDKNRTKGSSATKNEIQRDLVNRSSTENCDPGLCERIIRSPDSAEEISLKMSDSSNDDIPMLSADDYANIDVVDEESFRAICDRQQNDDMAKNDPNKSEDREIPSSSSARVQFSEDGHADNILIFDKRETEKDEDLLITTNAVGKRSLNHSPDANEKPTNNVINVNYSPDAQSVSHLKENEVTQELNEEESVDEDHYFGKDDSQALAKCMELDEGKQAENEVVNNKSEEKEIEDFISTTSKIVVGCSNHSPGPSEERMDRVILVPASPKKQPISNEENDDIVEDSFTQDSAEENYFDSDDSEGLDKAICQVDDDFEMTSEVGANREGRVDDFGSEKSMENKFILISPDRATPMPLENTFMTPSLFSAYKVNTPQPRLHELFDNIPVYDNDPATENEKNHSGSELRNVSINSSKAIALTDNEDNAIDSTVRSMEIRPSTSRVACRNDDLHSMDRGNDDMHLRNEGGRSDAIIDLCDDVSVDEPRFQAETHIIDESLNVGAEDRSFNCGDIEFNVDHESFLGKHPVSDDDLSEPASPCVTTTQGERTRSNECIEGHSQGTSQGACQNLSLDNSGSSKSDAIDVDADVAVLSSQCREERDGEQGNSSKYGAIDSGSSSDEVIDTTPKKSHQEHTTNRKSPLIDLEREAPVSSSGKWLRAHSEVIASAAESSSSKMLSPRRKSTPKGKRKTNLVSESSTVSDKETDKCKRKTKTKRSTPSKKKSPPKKRVKQDTTHTAGKGAFKELLKRVSNEIVGRKTLDSDDIGTERRVASNNPSTSDKIEELQTSSNFSEVGALSPSRTALNSASTNDDIEELQISGNFSEVEALSPNGTLQSYSLSVDQDNNSINSCERTSEMSRNRRTREKVDATVDSNGSLNSCSQLTSVKPLDLSGRSANYELTIDAEHPDCEDDCVVSYPSFSQSFGDDGGFNVDICMQNQAGDNRSLKGNQPRTPALYNGLNASLILDTTNESPRTDRNFTTSRNDYPQVSFIDDGGFNGDIPDDVMAQDGESNAGSPSVVKIAARKHSANASSACQRLRISLETEPGATGMTSPSPEVNSHSRKMKSSLQEACTPLSGTTYNLQRSELIKFDLNREKLTSNEESRDEHEISNLGDLSSLNCDSDFVIEGDTKAGHGYSSVSEHTHDNNETLQHQELSIATPLLHAPMNVRNTPSTAVRNFTHGIGIHPETGDAITPMSDYDSLCTPALAKRVQAFGIRKVAKRQMAGKMREIYKMQHGFQHWEEPPPKAQRKTKQRKTKTDVKKRKAGSAKGKVVRDDNEEEDQSSSSSNDEGQMTFEGGNCSDDDTSSQSSRTDEQNKGSLVEKLLKFIKSNKVWYQRVLTYQKLNLDDFIKAVKEAGIKCSSKRLKDFLDEQCICFVCPRDDDKPRRKKRRRNPNK